MGEWFENFTADISGFVWGLPLIIFLVGTGLYLTISLAFFSFRMLPYSLKLVFTKADTKSEGDITHFQALMTALAATVGTGNVVGVATAVVIGGAGSSLLDVDHCTGRHGDEILGRCSWRQISSEECQRRNVGWSDVLP